MKRLVLVGGGHAHVHVLRAAVQLPFADTEIVLLSPHPAQTYSGMIPGWIAGHYTLAQCQIPLSQLAAKAGARHLLTYVHEVRPEARAVRMADGRMLEYDLLSINVGSNVNLHAVSNAEQYALPLRPLDAFVTGWGKASEAVRAGQGARIAVLGAGAAGVEVALAVRHGLSDVPQITVVLVSADSDILRGHPPAVRRMAAEALRGAGIAVIRGASAKRVGAAGVVLDNGHALEADHVLAATGPAAAEWVARSGLALTDDGFIRVDRYLRSTSHENVFAVGDCASNPERPRPKSGVFSVRAGLPLAANLRRALTGQRLLGHRPGRWSLYLLSCGRRYAIASWGPFSWSGESVWRWKDRIDRAFISRFTP